jgi:hypothetical protein
MITTRPNPITGAKAGDHVDCRFGLALGRIVRHVVFICFLSIVVGCANRSADCPGLVAQIRNDHIHWDGNIAGLYVSSMGEAERNIAARGSACRPFLVEALDDDSRFVAAHVLLTHIQKKPWSVSGAEWNHLRVELFADGRVEIPNGEKEKIKKLWTQR